jgi:superoxide dismutase, Cu-Zn family
MISRLLAATAFVVLPYSLAVAQSPSVAPPVALKGMATLKNAEGSEVGRVDLQQGPAGVVIRIALKNIPVGAHAFHVHQNGKCEPPFDSAGGHFNPDSKKHGALGTDGHHAGDMPNLVVPASGELKAEIINDAVTLEKGKPNSLLKDGGTAFIVHAEADDYRTDPTGNAGGRIACGVIE